MSCDDGCTCWGPEPLVPAAPLTCECGHGRLDHSDHGFASPCDRCSCTRFQVWKVRADRDQRRAAAHDPATAVDPFGPWGAP